ncbi:MAG: replication factor C small subunit [Thermoplasmata archaeon]|nr:replication factor C small subunit [Thermoplasmata archaeon]
MDSIWTEKHRPASFEEVVGQPQAVERLGSFASGGSLPHLLLAGPPGTGKTTCALILAKTVLGGMTEGNFLEIDASDLTKARPAEETEDGRSVVKRDSSPLWRIREFATNASIDGVRFRIAFIDEVDTLSKDVQEALRRTMEVYSGNCAFILSCNHPSMIIDPVRSRCTTVRFNPVPRAAVSSEVSRIAALEKVALAPEAADGIAVASGGDLRRAVLILQAAASNGHIGLDTIYKLTDTPASEAARAMMETALKGDVMKARDVLDSMMIDSGMSGREVIAEVHRQVLSLGLSDQDAVRLMDKVGETDHKVAQCGSGPMSAPLERVQLEALIAYLAMTGKRLKRR